MPDQNPIIPPPLTEPLFIPKKKWYQHKGLIAIFILILITMAASYVYLRVNRPKIASSNSSKSKTCERFMSEIAQAFAQPDLCRKVSLDIINTAGFNTQGLQTSYERSDCFNAVAEETGDENLCAEVKPISTQYLDGSKINQSYCIDKIEQAKKNNWKNGGSVPFYETDQDLSPIMSQLGYKATSTLASSTWSDYINNLALLALSDKTNGEVNNFLNRVKNFQCPKN